MGLEPLIRPWSGNAYRHIPYAGSQDILDFRFTGRSSDNRWNVAGEPTLYLASDLAVVLGEFARHFVEGVTLEQGFDTHRRQVFRLGVSLDRVIDLREASAWDALSLTGAPNAFLDRTLARTTAHYLRTATQVQGLVVPSAAFLDDPMHYVLVLFLEQLPSDPTQFITSVQPATVIRLEEAEHRSGQ